jgi:hypothetical protein
MAQQRLVAGAPQVLPAVLPSPPALPRLLGLAGWAAGALAAIAVVPTVMSAPTLAAWLLVPLVALTGPLAVRAWWRRRVRAEAPIWLMTATNAVMPPANPNIVMLWSSWLGRNG